MHKQLIADAAFCMSMTERGLFIVGLQVKRGMRSDVIAQTAGRDHDQFMTTGIAPEYMIDFCIDRINAERNKVRLKAQRKSATRIGPLNGHLQPAASGVDDLFENDAA